VTETTTSASNTNTISSSWFINFPEESKAELPVRLSLFGMITNAQPLSRKVKTMQCNRCWKWHNPRSCARNPRCRLCGSTQHTEEGHTNQCTTTDPHTCPPRCLHCHGPHPADYDQCFLRPSKPGSRFTKAQQAEIRKTCSQTHAKARAESKCCAQYPAGPEAPQDQIMTTTTATQQAHSPFRPTTPPQQRQADFPPATARAVRFAAPQPQNRYDILMNENL
jgi:hypothetical protein